MKKKYEAPKVNAVIFEANDIITNSGEWDFEFPTFPSTSTGSSFGGSGSGNETPERH